MPVLTSVTGHLGHLVLNRPAAINALTAEMVDMITGTLHAWASDDRDRTVLISGAGERGLCAGGDLRAMHADAVSGGTGSLRFWAREYELNALIAAYPKPVVAWMDGLVMGGGIGISAHASLRIVTERSRLAMPEVGIGFHPDVGGSWLLSRAPGELGTHLALTGTTIGAADAIQAGLADHFVPTNRLPHLITHLTSDDAEAALTSVTGAPPPGTSMTGPPPTHASETGAPPTRSSVTGPPPTRSSMTGPPPTHASETGAPPTRSSGTGAPPAGNLAGDREWIDECYAGDDLAVILERLAGHAEPAAQAAAREIAGKSPTSLAVTLRSLRSAAKLDGLRAALDQEYRLSAALLRLPDLAEGIRAQIIDKDRRPRWSPVPPGLVDTLFRTS